VGSEHVENLNAANSTGSKTGVNLWYAYSSSEFQYLHVTTSEFLAFMTVSLSLRKKKWGEHMYVMVDNRFQGHVIFPRMCGKGPD